MQVICEILIALVCGTWLYKNKDTVKDMANEAKAKAESMRDKSGE